MRVRRTALLPLLGTTVALTTIAFAAPASAKAPTPRCFGKKATIVVAGRHANGTKKNDVIVVTNKKGATVNGGAGNDLICGAGGTDVLNGGAGNDKIDGRGGNDVLSGGVGNDTLLGGAGNDKVDGGSGNDSLLGGAGNDVMTLGAGKDTADGGAGNDTITGGPGVQVLKGGAGNDHLIDYRGGTVAHAHVAGLRGVVPGCFLTMYGGPGTDIGQTGACAMTFIGDALDTVIATPGDAPVTLQGPVKLIGSTYVTPAGSALQGTVRGTGNAVLGGVTVRIFGSGATFYALTDTSGHYSFPADTPDGYYSLDVNPAGVAGHPQNSAYQASAAQTALLPHTGALDVTLLPVATAASNTITGLITDSSGPLANVPVSVYQHGTQDGSSSSIATDASGRYTISGLSAGHTYDIVANDVFAQVGTYLPRRSVGVKSNVAVPAAGTSIPTITLTHAATISGLVKDVAAAPVPDAFINAFNPQTQNVGVGYTGTDGHYTVGSLTDLGSWQLGAYAQGYEPAAATPVATVSTLDDQVTGKDIVVHQRASQGGPYYVAGSVASTDTNDSVAVPVTLRNSSNEILHTEISSSTDGSYFMPGTYPAGTYTLVVNDPSQEGFVDTLSHDVLDVTLPSNAGNTDYSPDFFGYSSLDDAGTLDVLVQDHTATPAPVSDELVTTTDYYGVEQTATTGSDGHAVLTGLVPGTLSKVTFTKAGYYADEQDDSIEITSNATQHYTAVAVPAANPISGTVTDNLATPAPLSGMTVYVCPYSDEDYPSSCLGPYTTDADGTWTTPSLPAGDYEVSINEQQGYNAAYGADDRVVSVSVTSATSTYTAALAAAGSIGITVYGPDGTTPVQGADVNVYISAGNGYGRYAFTDENGYAVITGVPAGSRTVMAEWDDGVFGDQPESGTSDPVDVTAGETATTTVSLQANQF